VGFTAFDGKEQAALFAHCASSTVNALYEPTNRYNEGRVSAMGYVEGSITPTFLPAPSGSTWQRWAGSRPATTISAESPNLAFSRPYAR